jgi:hypothetical protein
MRGGGERIPSVVENSREAGVEGSGGQGSWTKNDHMSTRIQHSGRYSLPKATERRNLSTHPYKIQYKWENQAYKAERRMVGGGGEVGVSRMRLYEGSIGYQ